jgi:hypothetical protein
MPYFSFVKAKHHRSYNGYGICLWGALLLLGSGSSALAQWSFLGPQWLRADGVAHQAMALNRLQQVHVASTSLGAAMVQRYDGAAWLTVGTGLPESAQAECDLAFDENHARLALGPSLALYALDNGLWQAQMGLPVCSNAHDLHLRIAHDHAHWLGWTQSGAFDSTFVATDAGGSAWSVVGAFAGRLVDLELNESDEPVVLQYGASALLAYDHGSWQPLPTFLHNPEAYVALAMTQDGTGTGAVVLRRDGSDALSVELLSNGNWVPLGSVGFAHGDAYDLQVDVQGILHLVTVEHALQAPPQARRYIAGSWQLLGGQYVYNNTVSQPQLAFDAGAAFVLFRDDEQALRPSVMYLGTPLGEAVSAPTALGEVYPNPVRDIAHLQLPAARAGATLRLCDVQGQVVQQWAAGAAETLDFATTHLAAGRYWLIFQPRLGPAQFHAFTKP